MAAIDFVPDRGVVICMHPTEADVLIEALLGRTPPDPRGEQWEYAWNFAQQILYERDREDRREYGCLACGKERG